MVVTTEDFRGDDAPKDDRRRDDDRVKDERGEAAPSLTLQSLSVDVLVVGVTYLDVVVADLDAFPGPGEEARAGGLTLCPGGIATRAVATARLGLDTVLSTSLGTDRAGALVRAALGQEAVRLDLADDLAGASTPVTVSVAHDGDRRMFTRDSLAPVRQPRMLLDDGMCRCIMVDLRPGQDEILPLLVDVWTAGAYVVADVGWDPSGIWDPAVLKPLSVCDLFTPNAVEAMAYTGADTPVDAARRLAEQVPLAVVTDGARGVHAASLEGTRPCEVFVPAVTAYGTRQRDARGAGDVFGAALVAGTLWGLPLADRLAFGALCAALSLSSLGGAPGAPGWTELQRWWSRALQQGDSPVLSRYEFLDSLLADQRCSA